MWRAGLIILMLSVYATGCIAQQLVFFAAQGLIRVDSDGNGSRDTLAYDFIPLRDPNTSGPNTGQVLINLMFINRPGLLNQPVRSAIFVFRPLPTPPSNTPNALVQVQADPAQAQNQMSMGMPRKRMVTLGPEQVYEVREIQVSFPARADRYDQNGNPTQQQGTVTVTIQDFYPFSFRRPKPDQPRDRILLVYSESGGYRFPPVGEYVAEINDDPTMANFFVHGRIVD